MTELWELKCDPSDIDDKEPASATRRWYERNTWNAGAGILCALIPGLATTVVYATLKT